jgi:glycosyltransferase involved in cell wall biosynthesis
MSSNAQRALSAFDGIADRPRLRLAWVEEWMSTLAQEMLPYLAARHEIYYVTAGKEIPRAPFAGVLRARRWRTMNLAGFALSRRVNALYREGRIDGALVWGSIGFGLRGVPFINLEGTSVFAEIELFASRTPWHRRWRFLTGLAHYALPERICNRRARRTIAPTEALRRDILRLHRLGDERVAVVPHGVEAGHLALYRDKSPMLPPRLLFVGRLHYRKGLLPILEAYVRRHDIDAEFLIAGDGPDRPQVERLAAADPRIKVLGQVDRARLLAVLRDTNLFVFPTFYEGFGLALTEAMASGHACLSYDIPVVREVLGETGVLVPLADATALVEAAAHLVQRPELIEDYARRAHQRAAQFSWDDARLAIERIVCDTLG